MEQLLPLGTIVKVNLGEKSTAHLMIAGYYPQSEKTGEVYDYLTVMYPFGMSYKTALQLTNKSSIISVEAMGYMDDEAEQFTKGLPELLEKAKGVILEQLKEAEEQTEKPEEEATVAQEVSTEVNPDEEFG